MSQNCDAEGTVSVPSRGLEDGLDESPEPLHVSLRYPHPGDHHRSTASTKQSTGSSRGEMEAAICREINRFERDYMGHGPIVIRAHLIGDLLIVRLKGVLTAAEKQLVKTQMPETGRELLKQVRM